MDSHCHTTSSCMLAGSRCHGNECQVSVPAGDREDEGSRLQVSNARHGGREETAAKRWQGGGFVAMFLARCQTVVFAKLVRSLKHSFTKQVCCTRLARFLPLIIHIWQYLMNRFSD